MLPVFIKLQKFLLRHILYLNGSLTSQKLQISVKIITISIKN